MVVDNGNKECNTISVGNLTNHVLGIKGDVQEQLDGMKSQLDGKVNKSGDTMTGTLIVENGSYYLREPVWDYDADNPPTENQYGAGYAIRNRSNTYSQTIVDGVFYTNGTVASRLVTGKPKPEGGTRFTEISVAFDTNNVPRGLAPNPPKGDNINSIATTQWVRNMAPYITSYGYGNNVFWRVWSNGAIEQGGTGVSFGTGYGVTGTITFPKPLPTANYIALTSLQSGGNYTAVVKFENRTTTTARWHKDSNNSNSSGGTFNWWVIWFPQS